MRSIRDDGYSTPVVVGELLGPEPVELTQWAVHAARWAGRVAAERVTGLPHVDAGASVRRVLAAYYALAEERTVAQPLNDQQLLGLLGNAAHLVARVAPALDAQLGGGTRVQQYAARQGTRYAALACAVKGTAVVQRSWQLSVAHYADAAAPSAPSARALKLYEWLRTLRVRLATQAGAAYAASLLPQLLTAVVEAARDAEDALWRHAGTLSVAGATQLALDCAWLAAAADALGWSGPALARTCDAMRKRALLEHCAARGVTPAAVFPDDAWFAQRLKPHLEELLQPPKQ